MSTEETEIVTATDGGLGAVGGSPVVGDASEVQLLDVSLNPKLAQDSGDSISLLLSEGEAPLEGSPLIKSELDGHDFSKNENKAARRASPSKRNSKRKRKNARRREKRALAALSGSGEDGEGRSSEDQDPSKEDEESCGETDHDTTGTESEIDGERLILNKVKVHEPIPEKAELEMSVVLEKESESGLFEQKEPEALEAREEESKEKIELPEQEQEQTPTHSVDTLLQITKDRILTGILKPSSETISETVGEEVIFAVNLMDESAQSTVYMDALEDLESSGMSVPPCSPSSEHNMINAIAIEPGMRPAERQKSVTKAVHFDDNPPEIVSVENIPLEERVFDLSFEKDDSFIVTAGDLESLEEAVDIICSSSRNLDETFVVADTLGAVDGVSSAVSSNTSDECLLKGSGSSVEVMTESSIHFPSRETVHVQDDGEEAVAMRERINIFKQEHPEEAEQIENELDTILTMSAERLSAVMEEEEEEEEEDDQDVQVQRLEDLPEAEMWKEPPPEEKKDRENNNETKETIFLVENIVHTDSAVSSVASASVESLLKGTGRNFEEFGQAHHHFPSREVDVDQDLIEVDLNQEESANEASSKGTPNRPQTPKFRDAGEGDTNFPLSHDRISALKRSEIDSDSAEDSPNFLPERAESLNKILAAKREADDAAADTAGSGNCSTLERKGTGKRGSRKDAADGQGQDGCNCAKLCTIQ